MLMEYAEEEEEEDALVDYLTARAVGRRQKSGQCSTSYTCPLPFSGSMASMAEMVSGLDLSSLDLSSLDSMAEMVSNLDLGSMASMAEMVSSMDLDSMASMA